MTEGDIGDCGPRTWPSNWLQKENTGFGSLCLHCASDLGVQLASGYIRSMLFRIGHSTVLDSHQRHTAKERPLSHDLRTEFGNLEHNHRARPVCFRSQRAQFDGWIGPIDWSLSPNSDVRTQQAFSFLATTQTMQLPQS